MGLLHEDDASRMRELFRSKLRNEVRIVLYRSTRESGPYSGQAEQLMREVASLTDMLRLDVTDFEPGKALAEEVHVEETPTTVIFAANGTKLYYIGTPAGYQLKCLVEDIIDASVGASDLPNDVKGLVRKVGRPMVVNVFVTPSCPYSPLVVRSAHRFAMENPNIRARMIEVLEFPDLAKKYDVLGVPRTVIDDRVGFDGALSEKDFAERLANAAR